MLRFRPISLFYESQFNINGFQFVVEMVQHMQCQEHHFNVHQEQQRGSIDLTDMIAAEKDGEKDKDNEMVEDRLSGRENGKSASAYFTCSARFVSQRLSACI